MRRKPAKKPTKAQPTAEFDKHELKLKPSLGDLDVVDYDRSSSAENWKYIALQLAKAYKSTLHLIEGTNSTDLSAAAAQLLKEYFASDLKGTCRLEHAYAISLSSAEKGLNAVVAKAKEEDARREADERRIDRDSYQKAQTNDPSLPDIEHSICIDEHSVWSRINYHQSRATEAGNIIRYLVRMLRDATSSGDSVKCNTLYARLDSMKHMRLMHVAPTNLYTWQTTTTLRAFNSKQFNSATLDEVIRDPTKFLNLVPFALHRLSKLAVAQTNYMLMIGANPSILKATRETLNSLLFDEAGTADTPGTVSMDTLVSEIDEHLIEKKVRSYSMHEALYRHDLPRTVYRSALLKLYDKFLSDQLAAVRGKVSLADAINSNLNLDRTVLPLNDIFEVKPRPMHEHNHALKEELASPLPHLTPTAVDPGLNTQYPSSHRVSYVEPPPQPMKQVVVEYYLRASDVSNDDASWSEVKREDGRVSLAVFISRLRTGVVVRDSVDMYPYFCLAVNVVQRLLQVLCTAQDHRLLRSAHEAAMLNLSLTPADPISYGVLAPPHLWDAISTIEKQIKLTYFDEFGG